MKETNKELLDQFAKAESEDSKNRIANQIIKNNMGYINFIAKKFVLQTDKSIGFDDFVQIASMALWKCIFKYDSTNKADFATYACTAMRNAIIIFLKLNTSSYTRKRLTAIRKLKENKIENPTEQEIFKQMNVSGWQYNSGLQTISLSGKDENACSLLEFLPDEKSNVYAEVCQKEELGNLKKALNALSDDERELIELYYFKDMTLQQIAEGLGRSREMVRKRLGVIRDKLYLYLENLYCITDSQSNYDKTN